MGSILVTGGAKLEGEIQISGAKNSALPIMAASILFDEVELDNIPCLTDIDTMVQLLTNHGVDVQFFENQIKINTSGINNYVAPNEIVRKMRASIWVLAPLLSKYGEAIVSMPGGCTLGARQVDLHIDGLKSMGAEINVEAGYIHAKGKNGLYGAQFHFSKISVGATMTMIMAAVLAKGETTLTNCAFEPEVVDLCNFLTLGGAQIEGIGTPMLRIYGVSKLKDTEYTIIPDRIETGTYMIAAGITSGEVLLTNVDYGIVENICEYLRAAGMEIRVTGDGIIAARHTPIVPVNVSTYPYPGFPTDLQAQFMALMTIAHGTSVIKENIFENRFMHVSELCRMNANIKIEDHHTAIVHGVTHLTAAEVAATDLRASASLVIAGLVARGETKVSNVHHLDRGYENMVGKLQSCGAKVSRIHNGFISDE